MIYTLPSENIANTVTPSLAVGTADASNPLANLTNGDPAIPFLTTDSVGVRVTWDFGSATRADYVSMPMHGIPAGTAVRFQMNATDSWGAPSVNVTLTMAYQGDFPTVAAGDITQDGGYLVGGYRFMSLLVPSHGGITKIGDVEIWSQKRTFDRALRFGIRLAQQRQATLHERVDGGRFVYDHQLQSRRIVGTFRHEAADFAKLKALHIDAKGPTRAFLVFIADLSEHLLVWWRDALVTELVELGVHDVAVEWPELGRGMPL